MTVEERMRVLDVLDIDALLELLGVSAEDLLVQFDDLASSNETIQYIIEGAHDGQ